MQANTNLEIQQCLDRLKTFGVSGKVYDPSLRAARQNGIYATSCGADALTAHTNYFTALASATPPTQEQMAADGLEAWEESLSYAGKTARWGDPNKVAHSKRHALAAARIEYINNWVWAYPGFMSWYYNETSLAADEQPFIINETMNEMSVTSISEDGSPERNRFIKPQTYTPVGLFFKSTKAARTKTIDLYRGNVAERINSTLDLARDMRIELDLTYFGLLNLPASAGGAFGAFTTENSRSATNLRLWNAHSAIDTTQFPGTNDYDLTQTAGTATNPSPVGGFTQLDVNIIYAIDDYCLRFGDIFNGPIVWTGEILVPAQDVSQIGLRWLATANTAEQNIQKQINEKGYMEFSMYGRTVKLIPSLFLTRGTCYPKFNRKPGIAFTKPGLDREIVQVNEAENWEERSMRKVFGAAIIAQWRQFVMRIKYSTASNSSSTEAFHAWPAAPIANGSLSGSSENYPTTS